MSIIYFCSNFLQTCAFFSKLDKFTIYKTNANRERFQCSCKVNKIKYDSFWPQRIKCICTLYSLANSNTRSDLVFLVGDIQITCIYLSPCLPSKINSIQRLLKAKIKYKFSFCASGYCVKGGKCCVSIFSNLGIKQDSRVLGSCPYFLRTVAKSSNCEVWSQTACVVLSNSLCRFSTSVSLSKW